MQQQIQIPIPYQVILKRFWMKADYERVSTKKASILLVQIFRMEKTNTWKILREMSELQLIEIENYSIKIKIPLEKLE